MFNVTFYFGQLLDNSNCPKTYDIVHDKHRTSTHEVYRTLMQEPDSTTQQS